MINLIKKQILPFLLIFTSLNIVAQEYKKWEQHDVIEFYEKHQIKIPKNE